MAESHTRKRETPPDIRRLLEVAIRLKWWVLGTTLGFTFLTLVATTFMTPIYEGDASLIIEKAEFNSQVQEEVGVETKEEDYYLTQYEILRSYGLAQKVVTALDLQRYQQFAGKGVDPAEILIKSLKIEPVPYSRVVHVLFDSDDPKLAASVANAVAKIYIKQNIENKSFLSKSILRLLNNTASREDIEALPSVVNSPIINELKVQLNKLDTEWADMSRRYTLKHPRMRQLQAQIKSTREQIDRETQNIVESEKLQLSMRLQINNIRFVDEARVPKEPVRPKKRKYMLLGLLMGLFASFIFIILNAHLDRTIRTPEDFASAIRLDFLGGIPQLNIKSASSFDLMRTLWGSKEHLEQSELFRNLRSVIALRIASIPLPNALLITSCIRGEGKSFISANLATAFAQTGERVLLIDADMRAPTAHKFFRIPTTKGLSTYLSSGTSPEAHISQTGVKNLYMMSAGPEMPNPTEMLTAPKLTALLNWAKGRVHRIIVDTPPIIPTTDALVWMHYVQAAIFLIGAGKVPISMIDHALEKLGRSASSTRVIGAVLNQLQEIPTAYYYGYRSRAAGTR